MLRANEFIARLRQWPEPSPFWQPSWPSKATEGHTGHFAVIRRECPVCGGKEDRILLREIRSSFAGDEELPLLLVLDLCESPRGSFTWEISPHAKELLSVPHYYKKRDALIFALLSPSAKVSIIHTRRYHEPRLWPWWTGYSLSGLLATQEGDARMMVWLEGDILPLPEPEVILQPHRRCRGAQETEAA